MLYLIISYLEWWSVTPISFSSALCFQSTVWTMCLWCLVVWNLADPQILVLLKFTEKDYHSSILCVWFFLPNMMFVILSVSLYVSTVCHKTYPCMNLLQYVYPFFFKKIKEYFIYVYACLCVYATCMLEVQLVSNFGARGPMMKLLYPKTSST